METQHARNTLASFGQTVLVSLGYDPRIHMLDDEGYIIGPPQEQEESPEESTSPTPLPRSEAMQDSDE